MPSSSRIQSLSVAETCYLAHTTRRKLSSEVSRADHDLRVLVGHANFLDSIMVELAEVTREQERQTIPPAKVETRVSEEPKRRAMIQTTVTEKPADDWETWESEESDSSDSDSGEERGRSSERTTDIPSLPIRGRPDDFAIVSREVDEHEEDEEDYEVLTLVRTLSHSPPRLLENLAEPVRL